MNVISVPFNIVSKLSYIIHKPLFILQPERFSHLTPCVHFEFLLFRTLWVSILGNSNIQFGNSNIQFGNSNIQFVNSNIQFVNSNIQFGNSNIQFGNSNIQFVDSNIQFGNSNIQFVDLNIQFGNSRFNSLIQTFADSNRLCIPLDPSPVEKGEWEKLIHYRFAKG